MSYVDIQEIPEDEQEVESSPETESEADNSQAQFEAADSEVSAIEIQPTGELYAWAIPSEQELEACARAWVSRGLYKLTRLRNLLNRF